MQDVPVMVTMELGRASKTLDELLEIGEQSLIELEKSVGDPVDIRVNGKLVARGEVVTVDENLIFP
jgi:flagellar motor switch protein FliN/FliY